MNTSRAVCRMRTLIDRRNEAHGTLTSSPIIAPQRSRTHSLPRNYAGRTIGGGPILNIAVINDPLVCPNNRRFSPQVVW